MAICHAEASRIGVRSHSGLRLEWARYPTAKWLACAGASMRFGSLIWNNQTALAKAATEHPAQTRRARPGLFRGSQAALRRRSAGIKRASPAFLPGRCSEGVPGSVAVNLRDRARRRRSHSYVEDARPSGNLQTRCLGPPQKRPREREKPGASGLDPVWGRYRIQGGFAQGGKRTLALRRALNKTSRCFKKFRRIENFFLPMRAAIELVSHYSLVHHMVWRPSL